MFAASLKMSRNKNVENLAILCVVYTRMFVFVCVLFNNIAFMQLFDDKTLVTLMTFA